MIDIKEVKQEMNLIINDFDILEEKVAEVLLFILYKDDPVLLGLSTSNPLGGLRTTIS